MIVNKGDTVKLLLSYSLHSKNAVVRAVVDNNLYLYDDPSCYTLVAETGYYENSYNDRVYLTAAEAKKEETKRFENVVISSIVFNE